jgi:hypothetical protein
MNYKDTRLLDLNAARIDHIVEWNERSSTAPLSPKRSTFRYKCIYTYMYMCIFIYVYKWSCICKHAYTRIYIYIYACMYERSSTAPLSPKRSIPPSSFRYVYMNV